MITAVQFLTRVEEIANEEPSYQQGHDGSDGMCDCIGLVIGAIRRAGGQWRGLHGSNYAARKEVEKLEKIQWPGELEPGEVVLKAYEPWQGGYRLPSRYEHGGEYCTGDLRDYYHIGVVISGSPLRIRHMTTPKPKMDTALGKWAWHGKLNKIAYGKEDTPVENVTISGGNTSSPINMRKAASRDSGLIAEIPQGAEAELLEDGGTWDRIRWNGLTGYVMSVFVQRSSAPGGETISVNRAELESIYDRLGDLLGLRG